jgi:Ni/Co efflux regulator RcnB
MRCAPTPFAWARAYNPGMPSSTLLIARRILLALAFAAPFAAVHAQTAPAATPAPAEPLQNQEQADGRRNQKVEHIHTEDSGASVDEVRYGGRTQSINVKPKSNMPGYEVLPNDAGTARGNDTNSTGTGARVWNVMKF